MGERTSPRGGYSLTLTEILNRLEGVKGGHGQYTARCPAHDDRRNSLSVSVGEGGRILLHCHAGCSVRDIAGAMGLTVKDLFTEEHKPSNFKRDRGKLVATYTYPSGAQKLRYADKSFTWRRPDGKGGWVYNRKGVPHQLYVAGDISEEAYIVEGEKDADNLHKLGYPAVSGEDGAGPGKWRREYTEQLKGTPVCIFQDNDAVGKAYAQETAAALYGVATEIRVLDLSKVWPDIPEHGDVSDLIERFGPDEATGLIVRLISMTPLWELPSDQKKPALETITAAELQRKDMPPIKFIVDKLLSVGLGILASPPKYGKSWMVLALCLAVSSGDPFLGYKTNQCDCLYLALEDSQRRLKTRMNKLLSGKAASDSFHFATMASPIDNGLFDELEDFLRKHPETGLIVIDTLQRVRGASHGKEGAYAADYREVGALKAFADQSNVALLIVHHLRKMKDDGDPFNMISGTNGIMGAADTTMVLTKEKRGDNNATFSVVGRDVESSDTVLRFNKDTCYWENLGDADWFAEQQARQEYQESPIVKTIKKLVEQSPEGWSGTMQQLMDAGRFIAHRPLADSTQGLSKKLQSLDRLLFENDGIVHERKKNGSGGGKHKFYPNTIPQFEELEQTEFDPFLGG